MPSEEEEKLKALEERAEALGGEVVFNDQGVPYIQMPSTLEEQSEAHHKWKQTVRDRRAPRGTPLGSRRHDSSEGRREKRQRGGRSSGRH